MFCFVFSKQVLFHCFSPSLYTTLSLSLAEIYCMQIGFSVCVCVHVCVLENEREKTVVRRLCDKIYIFNETE